MNRSRAMWAITAALATALSLSACSAGTQSGMEGHDMGSTSSAGPSAAGENFNDQDVTFAQMMVPHHEQAIDMAQTVLDKEGVDPAVVDLAEQIQTAQGPEIDQLNAWLEEWGADAGGSMEHGGHGGMMSEADLAELEAAEGAEASRLFLEQMIQHHEGAIDMAQAEVEGGQNDDAVALAEKIMSDQQAEIETMQELLSTL